MRMSNCRIWFIFFIPSHRKVENSVWTGSYFIEKSSRWITTSISYVVIGFFFLWTTLMIHWCMALVFPLSLPHLQWHAWLTASLSNAIKCLLLCTRNWSKNEAGEANRSLELKNLTEVNSICWNQCSETSAGAFKLSLISAFLRGYDFSFSI